MDATVDIKLAFRERNISPAVLGRNFVAVPVLIYAWLFVKGSAIPGITEAHKELGCSAATCRGGAPQAADARGATPRRKRRG